MSEHQTQNANPRRCVVVATVACLLSACNSEQPALTDANTGIGGDCSPFADLVVSYVGPGGEDARDEAMVVLGPPDDASVTIAENAVLEVGFIGLGGVIDRVGDDLRFHATASAGAEAAVYVGATPAELRYSGALESGSLDVDIGNATASLVLYVQVVGLAGSVELDAVEALQTACTSPHRTEDSPPGRLRPGHAARRPPLSGSY